MSFISPVMLLGLLAVPFLVAWYLVVARRRVASTRAFVSNPLLPSVAPTGPRWRRHAPMAVFGVSVIALIVAAARPQRTVTVPVSSGAVMLANDISSSMNATDVSPSREGAARRAASGFAHQVPAAVDIGVMSFARTPIVLQTPTPNHALAQAALRRHLTTSGGTAVGVAIQTAMRQLRSVPKIDGKRPPGAIVLISDGASNVGISPLIVAHDAKSAHIPVYTVSVGTPHGTSRSTAASAR